MVMLSTFYWARAQIQNMIEVDMRDACQHAVRGETVFGVDRSSKQTTGWEHGHVNDSNRNETFESRGTRMLKSVRWTVIAVMILCMVGVASAQMAGSRLAGTVRDPKGLAISNASVTLKNLDTGVVLSTKSGPSGEYVFRSAKPGRYDLKAESQGFQPLEVKGLILQVGQEVGYDLHMQIGSAHEVVNVEATNPLIQTKTAQVDNVITGRQLENLPLNSRYYLDLSYLTPGVVANQGTLMGESISVNGQRGFSNSYNVDGVSNTVSFAGYNRTAIPMDAIAEYQVLTNQMEPQYGQATGAVINAVTKSGTNDLHGTIYGFFRNSAMDAINPYTKRFTSQKPDTHRNLVGATVGGPIKKNKIFYFGSFEWSRDLQAVAISAPQEAGKVVAEGPTNKVFLGRLDYDATANTFYLRSSGQRNADFTGPGGIYTSSTGYNSVFNTNDIAFSWSRVFTPHTIGEFRADYSTSAAGGVPVTPTGPEIVRPSSVSGKFSTVPYNMPEKDGQFIYNLSITKGTHDLKFGASYLRVANTGSNRNAGDGIYYFSTDAPYDPNNPATWPFEFYQRMGPSGWNVPDNDVGMFAQDKWSIRPNFVLTYGLRYDVENFFGVLPPQGTLSYYIPADSSAKKVANDKDNFGPRVAFAYSPWGGKTVFRGGVGVFYGRIPLNEAALVINNTLNTMNGRIIFLYTPYGDVIPYPNPPTTGSIPQTASSLTLFDNNLQIPRTNQYTFGVQHQFTGTTALTADFIRVVGNHLWTIVNRNAPDPVTGLRANPNYRNMDTQSSIGNSWYTGLEVTLKNVSPKHYLSLSYTLAKSIDDIRGDPNAYGVTCSQAINSLGPSAIRCDQGYSNNDVRNRLVASGMLNLPLRFNVSSILSYQSGLPYTATAGVDLNLDDYANDYAPGYSRNTLRTPGFFEWDVRLAKRFVIHDRFAADLFAESFNVTNKANYNSYVGGVLSPLFMQPTAASDPRRMQFGFRFSF